MNKKPFDINYYLKNKNANKGNCRECNTVVPWARDRVISHKRANCNSISESKKQFFKAQNSNKVIACPNSVIDCGENEERSVDEITHYTNESKKRKGLFPISVYTDKLSVGQRDDIT